MALSLTGATLLIVVEKKFKNWSVHIQEEGVGLGEGRHPPAAPPHALTNEAMTTLLHTHEGAVPMHTAIEDDVSLEMDDKFVRWEAIRALIMTIGARDALNQALLRQQKETP
jgi:hypothetical protein